MDKNALNQTLSSRVSFNFKESLLQFAEKKGIKQSRMVRVCLAFGFEMIQELDRDPNKSMVFTSLDELKFISKEAKE